MHRTSLALALLAGLLAQATPSLAAAAVAPYVQEEFEFAELVPTDEAFATAEDAEQLLDDTLARIGVEVKLRGASSAAADAELAALAGYLRRPQAVPEPWALEAFWQQHAETRRSAGLEVLNPEDRDALAPVAASLGLDPDWFIPIVAETYATQDRVPLASPTKDEVRAYVEANFPPVSNAIRFLVWDSISEGADRIEALGVRASGALAELVLNDLENPFARPPFRQGGQNAIPAVDPLLLLTKVYEEGALRLVADHLDRGGLGWATRILAVTRLAGRWYATADDLAAIEPMLARIVQEPQLLKDAAARVAWFYSDKFAGSPNVEDRGLLSRALLELPAGHSVTRSAVGEASGSEGFHPALAELARRVASDPTYGEPYALRVADNFPGCAWVLGFAGSEHSRIPPQVLLCLKAEPLMSETTLEQRSNVAEAILLRDLPETIKVFPLAYHSGAIALTVPAVRVLAHSAYTDLRECLLAPTAPVDSAGVLAEVLRILPSSRPEVPWRSFMNLDWVVEELRRSDFGATIRDAYATADLEGKERLCRAPGPLGRHALYSAWLELEQTPQVEAVLLEILKWCEPSSAMSVEHLESLLSLAAEHQLPHLGYVLNALSYRSPETAWDAFGFATQPSHSIQARAMALDHGLSQIQGADRAPTSEELELVRSILLEPGIGAALASDTASTGASLGSRLAGLTVGLPHPLEDPEFVRAADPEVVDALLNSGMRPKMLAPLLERLADGLPVFTNRHYLWNLMQNRPFAAGERQALLAILDRRIDGYSVLKRLGERGDSALLPRFEAVLAQATTEDGGEAWSLGERLEAIRSLGRISTVESARVLRRMLTSGEFTAPESDLARAQLGQIAERLEQDQFWESLESGVPGREQAVAQLVEQLGSDSPPKRAAAARALGAIGATTLQPTLIELLEDADAGVRAAAVEALDLIALHVRRELAGDE